MERSFPGTYLSQAPTFGELHSLAYSPDGRWLVMECTERASHPSGAGATERLFLLDGHTGEVISRHDINASCASSLAFDPTSAFVAAALHGYDSGGSFPRLWRLTPAAQFMPRPPLDDFYTWEGYSQDQVSGSMALTLLRAELEKEDIENQVQLQDWSDLDIAYGEGVVTFSPHGQVLLFSLNGSLGGGECILIAYAVPSGKALWRTHPPVESSGQAIFSPDGRTILLPEQGGDLLVSRAEDGTFLQRMSTHLGESVQALAFDHDGKLWLAAEEQLVQYQPLG